MENNKYCDSCIAKEVLKKNIQPFNQIYEANYQPSFDYNGTCAKCGEKGTVTFHPQMHSFVNNENSQL